MIGLTTVIPTPVPFSLCLRPSENPSIVNLDALTDGFYVIYHDVEKSKTSFLKTTKFDEAIISDFNRFDIKL